jgi:hypothetical protein
METMKVTIQEMKLIVAKDVGSVLKFMEENTLIATMVEVRSAGLHGPEACADIGIWVEQLKKAGLTVVSHSVIFFRDPSLPGQPPATITSLLVERAQPIPSILA